MNDHTSIRTYEDACAILGESINEKALADAGASEQIIAQMKCKLVAKAINEGRHITFAKEGNTYIPCFFDYPSIQSLCRYPDFWKNGKVSIAPVRKPDGTDTFLCGCRVVVCDRDHIDFEHPDNLRFESEGKAYHFGKYFMALWAQAFLPDWNVDASRIIRMDISKDAPEEKSESVEYHPGNGSFAWGMVCGVISNLIFCLGMLLLRQL